MRRMRQALKRKYYLRKPTSTKDSEGNTYKTYGSATEIEAIIRHKSRFLDTAQYGERISDVLSMQYEGTTAISEGDGICVFVSSDSDPDYEVKSCKGLTEDAFKVYTLEVIA